jgi:thymidylate synthase (FAD)
MPKDTQDWFNMAQLRAYDAALNTYREALRKGIAKECARAVLPEGMVQSRLYMTGSVRSWLHYLQTRLGNGTQLEHRLVAEAVRDTLRPVLPTVMQIAEETILADKR